jgi:SSS family solute:Na+ symporter
VLLTSVRRLISRGVPHCLLGACLGVGTAFAQTAPPPSAVPKSALPQALLTTTIEWERLPDLPHALAGQAAGVSHGALIVAGGTDFPAPLFERGTKVWFDAVHVLERGATQWRTPLRLAHPLAYAAAVTIGDRVIVAGGADATHHYADVFALEWINNELRQEPLPPLPVPLAMAGATSIGRTIFVIGGQGGTDDIAALRCAWALDLSAPAPEWRKLAPIPGDGRILPVVSAQDGRVLVVSGAALRRTADGKVGRRYLTDAYSWTPSTGWIQLSDVPRPVVAAPAMPAGQSHLMVFGGDAGTDVNRIPAPDTPGALWEQHPGFSRDILAYHTITDTWTTAGKLPAGLVTTVAVANGDTIVLPGGEDRPRHRSAAVFSGHLAPTSRTFSTLDYAVLGAYFIPLLLIGRYFSSKNASTEDFFLGGRSVPWWAAGLSIYGTQISAITFLAIPAKAYAENWVFFLSNICIVLVAPFVVYFYLPFFRGLNVTTAYEYLERRFDVIVRLFGSVSFIALHLARMAIVLLLPAFTLNAVTGIDVYASILVMGVFCTLYTLQGGMSAVIWTDVMQVIVLLGAALISLLIITLRVDGGLPEILNVAHAAGKLHMFNWSWSATTASVWVVIVGNFLANLVPYTADQAVVQRYLTTRNERQAARAIWTNAFLTIPTSVLFFGVGTALYVFYRAHPAALNATVATDAIFSWFIARQLPPGISGLAVAGVFAAAMSTLSSGLNSMATAIVIDVQVRFKPEVSDAERLRLARWLTVGIGLLGTAGALLMAAFTTGALWDTFLRAIGLLGGGLAGAFALGIFTTRASARGALVGLIASAIVLFLVQQYTNVHFFLYAAIGMSTCVIVGYVVSVTMLPEARSLDGLTVYTRRRSARVPSAQLASYLS